jgi:hypothetical protein
MAFVTKIGLNNWPAVGDTLEVYQAGAARTGGNLVAGLTDIEGGSAITNPFVIPDVEFIHITTPTLQRIDIWWVEGGRYIVANVTVRNNDIPLLGSDPASGEAGDMWVNTTTNQFKIKTSTGTIVIEAFQFVAD